MLDNKPRFNYRTATEDEMLQHVLSNTHQTVQAAKVYYTKQGEQDVVDKIKRARNNAKLRRLEKKVGEDNENVGGGSNIHD